MPAGGAMVRQPERAVTAPDFDRDPQSILRFALEKNASVETIEKLMAVRRELQEEASKGAFDAALRDFQAEVPILVKTKAVPDSSGRTMFKYSPLEDILGQVRPLLQKHGFSFTLDTDVESKDGWVIAKCNVTHCAGHCRVSTAKFPLGTGTRLMSATQVFAAALTFASRRVFCNAFGLVVGGEDQLETNNTPKPQGPSRVAPSEAALKALAQELWNTLATVRGPAKDWVQANAWLWKEEILDAAADEAAPNLSAARFREVIDAAKKRLTP